MLSTLAYPHRFHLYHSTLSSTAVLLYSQSPYLCCTHSTTLLLYMPLWHVTLYSMIHSESVSNMLSTLAYPHRFHLYHSTLSSTALLLYSQSPYLCYTHSTPLLLYMPLSHVTLYSMIHSESISNVLSTSAYSHSLRIHQSTLSSTAILLYSQSPYLCCTHSTPLLLYVRLKHVTLYSIIHSESVSTMLSTSTYVLFVFTSQPCLPWPSHDAPNLHTFVVLILLLSYYICHSHMSHYTLWYIMDIMNTWYALTVLYILLFWLEVQCPISARGFSLAVDCVF
jgi:hypothetical protein